MIVLHDAMCFASRRTIGAEREVDQPLRRPFQLFELPAPVDIGSGREAHVVGEIFLHVGAVAAGIAIAIAQLGNPKPAKRILTPNAGAVMCLYNVS